MSFSSKGFESNDSLTGRAGGKGKNPPPRVPIKKTGRRARQPLEAAAGEAGTETAVENPSVDATSELSDAEVSPATSAPDADYVADERRSFLSRLYTGTGAFEVVGKRKMWYIVTAVIIAISILSIATRQFTFGIDFEGGTQISVPSSSAVTTESVSEVFSTALGESPESVQTAGTGASQTIVVRTETLSPDENRNIENALAAKFGPELTRAEISVSDVSSTWGREITEKMLIALAVFLLVVTVYIAVRFDREMSIAALVSLFFDIVCTAGVYSLVGWEVTPATVIGLLTILGFSLYDTVVVFDKVAENTRSVLSTTRRTYAEQANLAVNQTLMRSINTTVISVLPIIALMVIAVWMLGVGTLKDLALIQLVGVVVGAYSSIFLAAPLLVTLKERRDDIGKHTRRVLERRARIDSGEPVAAAAVVSGDRSAARKSGSAASPAGKRRRAR
ncbi:protein-export membrane protein SecF [Gordonia effusa NBRC 100432]|uniref:Protein-export membrane protein SecF n=1 Tax=Gordonia effusa NBRC 100432 TaxID=1077974 RepID=H0QZL2_9ACTN|nr:protein translocase subunit SecF [Gordonia effusa]GAB18263.1 protein-export membrane protein SecF [Gordonia effusa NBRC 100432]